MANWRHKIELNGVLAKMGVEYDLSQLEKRCPKAVKDAIAAELDKAPPLMSYAEPIRKAKSIAEVNRVLERVYDAADRNLVWCGWQC